MLPADLHARIARALGWTVAEARSYSLAAARDLVRFVDAPLAAEISAVIQAGAHITRARRS